MLASTSTAPAQVAGLSFCSQMQCLVLVDADGTAYAGVSDGIFKSLQNLVSIFGAPTTWERPIPVQVQRVKGNNGYSYHTLKIG